MIDYRILSTILDMADELGPGCDGDLRRPAPATPAGGASDVERVGG